MGERVEPNSALECMSMSMLTGDDAAHAAGEKGETGDNGE